MCSDHSTLKISNKDIVDNFEKALYFAEIPSPRSAFVPMYLLSKQVSQSGIKVVLTGEGADEIFLGYDIFREIMIKEAIRGGANFEQVKPILENVNSFMVNLPNFEKFIGLKFANYRVI